MSDFSSKCREYLTDTGETVYQLASSSGLDRTSLQRMLTGKRWNYIKSKKLEKKFIITENIFRSFSA